MFTSSRYRALPGVAALGLLAGLLGGCAGTPAPQAVAPLASTGAGMGGTVAAVRPVPTAAAGTEGQLLAALGQAQTVSAPAQSEVLVRTDDGQVLSVLVPAAEEVAPGARVVVLPGAPLRLGRPGLTAPAS
ncbi:hypothetical protein [Acidisoma sp. 7E03]